MFSFIMHRPIAELFLLGIVAGYQWAAEADC